MIEVSADEMSTCCEIPATVTWYVRFGLYVLYSSYPYYITLKLGIVPA